MIIICVIIIISIIFVCDIVSIILNVTYLNNVYHDVRSEKCVNSRREAICTPTRQHIITYSTIKTYTTRHISS